MTEVDLSALTDAARAAYIAAQNAADTALQEQRQALNQAATAALQAVLGTMTLAQAGLSRAHRDLDVKANAGVVVWSDGTIALAAQKRPNADTWQVRVVEGHGTDWTVKSEPVSDLASLGRALVAS